MLLSKNYCVMCKLCRGKSNELVLTELERKYPVESDAAVYVDVDAEIQKELEDRLSSSLIDKAQLELLEKLGEGKELLCV